MYSEGFLFILWGYGTFRVVGVGIVVGRVRRWLGVSHGRHGVPDAHGRLGARWAMDSVGRYCEACFA